MVTFPDETEVRRIAEIADGAARNQLITDSYFRLSAALRERLPGGASWCTFATWASRQAGVTIRHADLVEALRQRMLASEILRGALGRLHARLAHAGVDVVEALISSVSDLGPFQRSSAAVASGNQKVYEEIGFEFARFLARSPDIAAISDAELAAFSDGLRDGDPPDGQGLLKAAFGNYRAAARAASAKERAEWLLLANLQIGFHEQRRLQPDIRAAMDGAVIRPGDLADLLLERLGEPRHRVRRMVFRLLPFLQPPLRRIAREVAEEVCALARMVATEHLARLTLPAAVVRLGEDLARPFPPALGSLENHGLVELLTGIDPTLDSPAGSGAEDWADLPQRMRLIAELFRAYQEDDSLFAAP